jgi:hypothetical protein
MIPSGLLEKLLTQASSLIGWEETAFPVFAEDFEG